MCLYGIKKVSIGMEPIETFVVVIVYSLSLYLIISTLLFKKASRAAPFNMPFWSKARSMS